MSKKLYKALPLAALVLLSGCKDKNPTVEQQSGVVQSTTYGDAFLAQSLKCKTVLKDKTVSPYREIVLEYYVDGQGDGQGLIGFGDLVYELTLVNDVIYVHVDKDTGTILALSDITGHGVPRDAKIAGNNNLASEGFVVNGSAITGFTRKTDVLEITTQYASSTHTFNPASITATEQLPAASAAVYIMDYNSAANSGDAENPTETVVEDFYARSPVGVTIEGEVYSVGDTLNPSTYFKGLTPEGILTSSVYKEDTRVDFLYNSYISTTGRSVFVTNSNYITAINTTADFEFLGVAKGTDSKTLKSLLGYKLSSKEMESWTPIHEALTVKEFKNNTYYCSLGNLNVEFRLERGQALAEIYIEQVLNF